MNKLKLVNKAYELYSIENLSADEIAVKLGISRRTVFNWMKRYNWVKKRVNIKNIKNNFGKDTEELVLKMMKKVSSDIDSGRKVSQEELYSVLNILEYLPNLKKIPKIQIESENPKTLTPEMVEKIQKEVLGLDI